MATTANYLVSFVPFGRSIMNFRGDQSPPGGVTDEQWKDGHDPVLAAFYQHVADLLGDLDGDDLLSITWIRKLIDSFLICQEEFRAVLFSHSSNLSSAVMADFFDRAVKALDVLNAINDEISYVKLRLEHLDIVFAALDPQQRVFGEGQLMRAKKALGNIMHGDNDHKGLRPLQLKALTSNLAPPRPQEIAATHGLASAVFTMSSVLLFVAWALAAALTSCDALPSVPTMPGFPWALTMQSLQRRVLEASKRKKGRNNKCGLMVEMGEIEGCGIKLMELMDMKRLPLRGEKDEEVRRVVHEMARDCGAVKDGCGPLEQQLREVFHRMVRNRIDGMLLS